MKKEKKSGLLPEQAEQTHRGFSEALSEALSPLPESSLESLRARGFSNDEIYAIVAPRRTLARRKERGESLTQTESDRVRRVQRISDMADRVFADHEKAQRWLRKPSRAMNHMHPIKLLESESGAHELEQELHRIDFGIFV